MMRPAIFIRSHVLVSCWLAILLTSACMQSNFMSSQTIEAEPIVESTPAEPPFVSDVPPTAESTGAFPLPLPAQILDIADSPLPAQALSVAEWQTFTHPSGVSFRFPIGWQAETYEAGYDSLAMHLLPNIPSPSQWPIQFGINFLPKEQEASLYHFAGEVVSNGEGWSPTQIVWDKQATYNGLQWHIRIEGESKGVFRGYYLDGVESLAQKGAVTEGAVIAIHYMEEKESYLFLSQNLGRDMLIALDQDGGDVVWSEYLQTFAEILTSITITP